MNIKIINTLSDEKILQLLALYRDEWWSKNRTEADVKEMLSHTDFVFIATDLQEKNLYGFARVLSDHVYFALIFDLIVSKDCRNRGIATSILNAIKNHPIISEVEYLELCCRKELIPFYQKQGFKIGESRVNIVKSS